MINKHILTGLAGFSLLFLFTTTALAGSGGAPRPQAGDSPTLTPAPAVEMTVDATAVMGPMTGSMGNMPMMSGTPMANMPMNGAGSASCPMMAGMDMTGMSGTTGMGSGMMGSMAGMSATSMPGMNMGGSGMAMGTGMGSGMMMGGTSMNMNQVETDDMPLYNNLVWYRNPWYLLGWLLFGIVSLAFLVALVVGVVWVIRRTRPAPPAAG